MSPRTLVNTAYAYLSENQDTDGQRLLDRTLEDADRTMALELARRYGRPGVAGPVPRGPMTEEELIAERARRLRATAPDQSRSLAAQMAKFQQQPGARR